MVGHKLKRGGTALAAMVLAAGLFHAPASAQAGDLVARWNGATPAEQTITPVLTPEERNAYRHAVNIARFAASG